MRFSVEISEVLARTLCFDANSEEEALETVKQLYRNELVVLDSADFCEVTFNIEMKGIE